MFLGLGFVVQRRLTPDAANLPEDELDETSYQEPTAAEDDKVFGLLMRATGVDCQSILDANEGHTPLKCRFVWDALTAKFERDEEVQRDNTARDWENFSWLSSWDFPAYQSAFNALIRRMTRLGMQPDGRAQIAKVRQHLSSTQHAGLSLPASIHLDTLPADKRTVDSLFYFLARELASQPSSSSDAVGPAFATGIQRPPQRVGRGGGMGGRGRGTHGNGNRLHVNGGIRKCYRCTGFGHEARQCATPEHMTDTIRAMFPGRSAHAGAGAGAGSGNVAFVSTTSQPTPVLDAFGEPIDFNAPADSFHVYN
jgi:hypothetical protein